MISLSKVREDIVKSAYDDILLDWFAIDFMSRSSCRPPCILLYNARPEQRVARLNCSHPRSIHQHIHSSLVISLLGGGRSGGGTFRSYFEPVQHKRQRKALHQSLLVQQYRQSYLQARLVVCMGRDASISLIAFLSP